MEGGWNVEGKHVAFLDVAEKEGATLEAELLKLFGTLRVKFITCDISDPKELDSAYKQVVNKYRRLDVVINCAAVLSDAETAYRTMVNVNFSGTVTSSLKAFDVMRVDRAGTGGVVVNISSLHAFKPASYLSVYSATKAAVLQFSNYLAASEPYSQTKVRVITVCLGPTDTALLHKCNLEKSVKDSHGLSTEPQRVASAVAGIIGVIEGGENGSTWVIANDKPALDVTRDVSRSLDILANLTQI